MKFYIVSNTESGTDNIECAYHLVCETGELIGSWISSSKYWAKNDLYIRNKTNQEKCLKIAGTDTIDVVFLGDDEMTNKELLKRNKNFTNNG